MREAHGVFKAFNPGTPNEVAALQGVDMAIQSGTFVVVGGSTEAGKTTLGNAVAGGVLADAGSSHSNGWDVTRWPEHRRAKLIGRVFQNPFSGSAPDMSIAENIALAARRGRRRGLGWALRAGFAGEMRERVRGLGMGLE